MKGGGEHMLDRDYETSITPSGWTLAQDGAQASIELAQGYLEHCADVLDDDESDDLASYRAAQLALLSAIAHGLLDVAAAIREVGGRG